MYIEVEWRLIELLSSNIYLVHGHTSEIITSAIITPV